MSMKVGESWIATVKYHIDDMQKDRTRFDMIDMYRKDGMVKLLHRMLEQIEIGKDYLIKVNETQEKNPTNKNTTVMDIVLTVKRIT